MRHALFEFSPAYAKMKDEGSSPSFNSALNFPWPHLIALAVHLEATGQREKAAEFQREHDRLRKRTKDEGER